MRRTRIGFMLVILLVSVVATPALAITSNEHIDKCKNAENGPGANGPPGFVANLVPDFIADLIGSLPIPNFVKSFFGASTCS